jgi:hypothetical protein
MFKDIIIKYLQKLNMLSTSIYHHKIFTKSKHVECLNISSLQKVNMLNVKHIIITSLQKVNMLNA